MKFFIACIISLFAGAPKPATGLRCEYYSGPMVTRVRWTPSKSKWRVHKQLVMVENRVAASLTRDADDWGTHSMKFDRAFIRTVDVLGCISDSEIAEVRY